MHRHATDEWSTSDTETKRLGTTEWLKPARRPAQASPAPLARRLQNNDIQPANHYCLVNALLGINNCEPEEATSLYYEEYERMPGGVRIR